MQHINDDMDELFRRAADDYPLKTDNANWDVVAKKLLVEQPVSNKSSKNNYKYLLLLLLLIPLGLLYNYVSNKSGGSDNSSSAKNINKDTRSASLPVTTSSESSR